MSYEVTATRRRPQKFDDLVGQEFVAQTLKNSIKSGKIAHAYLFSGPRGCGKTSTARILAKALNCQNGPTDEPCGTCSNCMEITKGSSLDVIEIDGASNTSVENIRQIKDEVLFPPNSCRYKIYIIDEVHMLSTSAFNALLKTIEEPPPYVIFIFATTELQKVPATIKSRCQQFNFRLVAIEKVKECLSEAAKELNIKAEDEALFWIARESTGSMRDAYTLFDQVVAFSDGHITYEKIRDKLGLVGIDRLNMIFESCAYGRTDEVLNSLDEFLQGGVSIEQLISNCADYLRSLLLIKSGISKESLLGNTAERYSKVVLGAWNPVQIERALSIYLQLYRDIRYSLSPRYELELAFSRMCWIGSYVSSVEVKKAIDAAKSLLGAPDNSAASPVQKPVITEQPVSLPNNTDGMNIPNGLPRLSMLDEQTPPFHDGGTLPPEQIVESQEQNQPVEEQKTKELDERLKLHVADLTAEEVPNPSYVVVPSADKNDYSINPDDEDDGWTNIDTPPDEYENNESYYEESYENDLENEDENTVVAPEKTNQSDQFFSTQDGRQISIAQLRGTVTATLSISDGFAASAIEKTANWSVNGDSVETSIDNEYDRELLQKKVQIIASEISKICGKSMQFVIHLKKQKQNESTGEGSDNVVPKQIQVLCDVFKGNIIAGKK